MTNEAWIERQTRDAESRKHYEEERLILWATEAICDAMERRGFSKADLASSMGSSRAHVTQLLSGSRNMTLRSLSNLAFACDMRVDVKLQPLSEDGFMPYPVRLVGRPRPRLGVEQQADSSPHLVARSDDSPLAA